MSNEPSQSNPSVYAMRTTPEDFVVTEEPLYPVSGEGGHTFLFVEKRGRTTEQLAGELARLAGASPRDVGYAGRKDRHAVTRQWFSIPDLEPARALDFELRDARVLEAHRHGHKLKTGHLRRNHFDVVLRGGPIAELAAIRSRVDEMNLRGLPNRYGEQRFGRDGDNAEQARKLLASGVSPRDRRAARFLISALQSEIFNAVLDARVDGHDRVVLGDLARVEESGGLFWVDDLDRETPRAAAFEISATGPIFGTRMRAPRDVGAEIEAAVFDRFELSEPGKLKLPRGIRARGGRRPLRVRPIDLEVTALPQGEGIRIRCGLPPGSYVTVLLESLVGTIVDAARAKTSTDEGDGAELSSPEGT